MPLKQALGTISPRSTLHFQLVSRIHASFSMYLVGTPDILWESFEAYTPEIPATMVEIMSNWTYKSGYPLLTVTASGDDVTISQVPTTTTIYLHS